MDGLRFAGICFYLIHRFGSNLVLWGLVALQWLIAQHEVTFQATSLGGVLGHPLRTWPAVVGMTVAFLLLTAVALGALDRVRWRFLVVLGSISYPLYLLHQGIGWTLISALRTRISPLPLVAGLVTFLVLLSWAITRLVERPLSKLLRTRLRSAIATISAASPSGSRDA